MSMEERHGRRDRERAKGGQGTGMYIVLLLGVEADVGLQATAESDAAPAVQQLHRE
jgi:hypothetical protein